MRNPKRREAGILLAVLGYLLPEASEGINYAGSLDPFAGGIAPFEDVFARIAFWSHSST